MATGTDEGHGGHTKWHAAIKTPDLEVDAPRSSAKLRQRPRAARGTHSGDGTVPEPKSGPSSNPLVEIYQRHDAADANAALEKWTDHVAALAGEHSDSEKAQLITCARLSRMMQGASCVAHILAPLHEKLPSM